MFGINNAIRSVATGISVSVDSAARTAVGGLSMLEEAVKRRSTEFAIATRTAQYELEITKDLEEASKSLGHKDLAEGIAHVNNVKALLLNK